MSHELRTPLNVVLGMAELIHNTSALGSTQKQVCSHDYFFYPFFLKKNSTHQLTN